MVLRVTLTVQVLPRGPIWNVHRPSEPGLGSNEDLPSGSYGVPIGGVFATENAVIPYAVGVDIACRMKVTGLDARPGASDDRIAARSLVKYEPESRPACYSKIRNIR